jgi:hypothetical protein
LEEEWPFCPTQWHICENNFGGEREREREREREAMTRIGTDDHHERDPHLATKGGKNERKARRTTKRVIRFFDKSKSI